jgi:hypothetical protein
MPILRPSRWNRKHHKFKETKSGTFDTDTNTDTGTITDTDSGTITDTDTNADTGTDICADTVTSVDTAKSYPLLLYCKHLLRINTVTFCLKL